MKSALQLILLLSATTIDAAPSSGKSSCRVTSKATDNFDDQSKYGAAPLTDLNIVGNHKVQGAYVTYTNTVVASDAGVNNLPPPSGHNWIGTIQGGVEPNSGYDAFRLYQWKFACTAATGVQDVNVIPYCKITVTCAQRDGDKGKPADAANTVRQSFSFSPDGTLGLTGHFMTGTFTSNFQNSDLVSCTVAVDEAYKIVAGATVPLGSGMVIALFDDVQTSGVQCS